jgi:hypothetical protein
MMGRVDIKYWPSACRKMRNFVPALQGPARRRPPTVHVTEVKDSADRCWLMKFEFNIEQAYVLEFGDEYVRFYANHGYVVDPGSPPDPLEVATPYSAADLTAADGTFNLRSVQSGDVAYIVHGDHPPQKLSRTAADAFTLAEMVPEGGPFKKIDNDETITVYSDANTGTVTLTASSAIFLAGHIGSLFYLEQKNVNAIAQWEPAKAITANAVRLSDGKNYTALNSATTGTIRPVHPRGAVLDGNTGVQWRFDDPGYGWVRITAIGGGGTTATATVLSRIPDGAVGSGNASTRWAHAAWSDVEGWPTSVTFFRERLCFSRGRNVWQSVAGDFENFKSKDDGGIVTQDAAITSDMTSDRANRIEWIAPFDVALLVGTAGDEHALSEITTAEALGPGNIKARKQHEYGSRHVNPVRVGDGIVFVQKSGRKVRDMLFSWEKEGFVATDTTILAEHIAAGGIIDLAYQAEPDSVVWGIRGQDFQPIAMSLNREQEIRGWHPHRFGGVADANGSQFAAVESFTTIPAPDGGYDEVWMIIRRWIDGASVRYVEWMRPFRDAGDDPEDAYHLDSSLTLDNTINAILTPGAGATVVGTTGVNFAATGAFVSGDVGRRIHYRYSTVSVTGKITWQTAVAEITAYVDANNVTCTILVAWPSLTAIAANGWKMTVTTISGFDHLEGEEIDLWVNGSAHPAQTVVGGEVTLSIPGSKVQGGLSCPAVLQPMPLEAAAADGTAQGKTGRISRCIIRFHDTAGARYGRDEDEKLDRVELRSGGTLMDQALPLFTGDKVVDWPRGYDGQALITIVQDTPGPCTVVALMPQFTVQDSR